MSNIASSFAILKKVQKIVLTFKKIVFDRDHEKYTTRRNSKVTEENLKLEKLSNSGKAVKSGKTVSTKDESRNRSKCYHKNHADMSSLIHFFTFQFKIPLG